MIPKYIVTFDLGPEVPVSFGPFDTENEAEVYAIEGAHGLEDHIEDSEIRTLYCPEETI